MALFVGEFETSIDGKHRLAIASDFREQINPSEDGQNFILALGPDRHLRLYPDLYYRRLLQELKRSALPTRSAGNLTVFFGTARIVKPDAQGRIVLPEKSMSRSVIAEKVTLVGSDDHMEIWPSDEWEKHVAEVLPKYQDVMLETADRLSGAQPNPGNR